MRRLRRVLAAVSLSVLLGCSADMLADDADIQGNAISPDEAARRESFDLVEQVLANEPASSESARQLGIRHWTVYAVSSAEKNLAGTLAYATDPDGDVKYAVATLGSFDGRETSVSLYELGKDGAKATLDERSLARVRALLKVDLDSLGGKIERVRRDEEAGARMGNGFRCAARLAGIGIAGVGIALAGTVTFALTTATIAASAGGAGSFVLAVLVATAGAPVAAGAAVGVAATATFVADRARRVVWTDTIEACSAAVR